MYLEDLNQRIRTAAVVGIGSNVFINGAPEHISQCVMVLPPLDGVKIDGDLPHYYRGMVQIIVRHAKEADAYRLAREVSDLLEMTRTQLPTVFVAQLRALNLPLVYPRSEGDFYEASVTFDFRFVETAP